MIEQYEGQLNKYTGNKQTVQEFADEHPQGTFLIRSSDPKHQNGHLCTLIDGDLYDSWNSYGWRVDIYYPVSNTGAQVVTSNGEERYTLLKSIVPALPKTYDEQIRKLSTDYMTAWWSHAKMTDANTIIFEIHWYNYKAKSTSDKPTLDFTASIKLSPKEPNIEQAVSEGMKDVLKKAKQKLYVYDRNRRGVPSSWHNTNVDIIPEHDDWTHLNSLNPDEKRLIAWLSGHRGYYNGAVYTLPKDPWFEIKPNGHPLKRDFEVFGGVTELKKWLQTYIKSNGATILY